MDRSGFLVLVVGLPGTGKTTFAKRLAKHLQAHHLNSDKIRFEMGQQGRYDNRSKARVYQELIQQTDRLLRQQQAVVLDATLYKSELRQPYLELAEKHQIPIHWVEMNADENTIRDRVDKKRTYSEADFSVYLKIKANYEPLTFAFLPLPSDQLSLEEMINKADTYLSISHTNLML